MQHLYIITGASRGLGQALAQQLLQPGHRLLTLARHYNDELRAQASASGVELTQWRTDLADASDAAKRLAAWLQDLEAPALQSAALINNAGVLPPIVPLREAQPADVANALRVGLEAAMLLSAAFLGATAGWPAQRRLLNISSGLGRYPMASQAPYCAAKAGMDLFTRCVALEEAAQPHGAQVCALAPGVIATDMQVRLRSADPSKFPDIQRFKSLQESGALDHPADTARRILRYLHSPQFGNEALADLREVMP